MRKISKEQWLEIDELLKDPERNITHIAKRYNISQVAMHNHIRQKRNFFQKLIRLIFKG